MNKRQMKKQKKKAAFEDLKRALMKTFEYTEENKQRFKEAMQRALERSK